MATITGNTWTATVRVGCPCGGVVRITAQCLDSPPCMDGYDTALTCNCCPDPSTIPPCVEFDASGQGIVGFKTHVKIDPGCAPVTIQRDFGDGNVAPPQTFTNWKGTPQTFNYLHIHSYAPGHTRVSTLNVLSPTNCRVERITVTIDASPPACVSYPIVALLCKIAYLLVLFFAPVAAILTAVIALGCTSSLTKSSAIGAAIATGVLLLVLLLLDCKKCTCMLLIKLLGQFLLVLAVLVCLFVFPPRCIVLTVKYPMFLVIVAAAALLGLGFLVLWRIWYGQGCCPVFICDFWKAVVRAMTVAFAAAIFVYAVLSPPILPANLLLALIVLMFILYLANIQANANKC